MNGPNTTTWYGILFGWMLTWITPEYSFVVIILIGVIAMLSDVARSNMNDGSENAKD